MTLANDAQAAPGAGPPGPEGTNVAPGPGPVGPGPGPDRGRASDSTVEGDPIFRAEEPLDRPARGGTLVLQFFLVPLLIVVAAVGIFLFFGAMAGARSAPGEYLQEVMTGGDNAQKQAAHQLGVLLTEERTRVDERRDPKRPPFWEQAGFRERLRRAFVESFPDRSAERRAFLALSLGKVGDPSYLETLRAHAGPEVGGRPNPSQVRFAVVTAIGEIDADEAVAFLASVLRDATAAEDEPLRNRAAVALSRRDTPAAREALRAALSDPSAFVRSNAGAALARFGDRAGAEEVARLLDPAAVERLVASVARGGAGGAGDTPADMRRAALTNGIRGALGLRDEALRAKVEALADDGDDQVRRLARDALDRWPQP